MIMNFSDCKVMIQALVRAALAGMFEFVIASCYVNAERKEETPALHAHLADAGFVVIAGDGWWKGEQEQSLLILPPHGNGRFSDHQLQIIFDNARGCKQETIIHAPQVHMCNMQGAGNEIVENAGEAYLSSADGKRIIGYLSGLTIGDDARNQDGYSVFADIAFSYLDMDDAESVEQIEETQAQVNKAFAEV